MRFSGNKPKVSVIIPVFNSGETLKPCLEAVFKSDYGDFEVIVVDDCSTDNSREIAEEFDCRLVTQNKRSGPALARNRGAEDAGGRFLIFMDSDVMPHPQTVGQLIEPLEKGWDSCIGIYEPCPGYKNFSSVYKNIFIWHYHNSANGKVDWFWTACGSVKKDIFCSLGGFSESYSYNSIEDIEFGYRMTKNGYRILLNKEAVAKHLRYFGIGGLLKNDFRKGRDWTYLNLSKNPSLSLKHPVARLKSRGRAMIMNLAFIFLTLFSVAKIEFLPLAVVVFFVLPFMEKRFFSSLSAHGGRFAVALAVFIKPIDDLAISAGSFIGGMRFLFNKRMIK
ncbi:MAG: glycosyltransferase [Candidatus Omnitrophica bacterium]|nr:glycosyltransferase [Candidatus Omnitrophota bacterium]